MNPYNADLVEQFYLAYNANVLKETVSHAEHAYITNTDGCNSCE